MIIENGRVVKGRVYRRPGLAAGAELTGPAVVSAPDTTVFVPSGFRARVDRFGNLRMRAERQEDNADA